MDGNKDAAQRCVAIGNKALKDGDKARAYRFLVKAQRLDPKLPLESLLSSLSQEVEGEESNDGQHPTEKLPEKDFSEKEISSSKEGMNDCNGHTATKETSEHSAEQVGIIRRIRKTKDYYQLLGLNKDCSSEDVRKAYRKISLKVHPDKNKAPGAEEAFKAVSKAFACLNDHEHRKNYDQYGPEEAHEVAHQQHRRNGFVYETFDAEEIFNSFFSGEPFASNGFQRAYFVRPQRAAGSQAGGVRTQEIHFGRWVKLIHMLPILALFLINYLPSSTPVFSLYQIAPYNIQYSTKEHSVPFFVKSQEFDKDYPPESSSRRSIEAQVLRDHQYILEENCRRELSHRYWNPSLKTPNCDRLRRLSVY